MTLKANTKKFKFVGGDISLDFVNTVSGRFSNPHRTSGNEYLDAYDSDKLEDYADLLAWSIKAELITEAEAKRLSTLADKEPKKAENIYQRAVALRESIYRLFKSIIEGWQPEADDVNRLNRELSTARQYQRFFASTNNFVFKWIDREKSLDSMLWQVTAAAVTLLSTADLTRLRQCQSTACNWLFLDTSRNRSRQWCDMKDCGNHAKVRRFRQKQ